MAGKTDEPRTPCRTPAEGRDGVSNIPTWKYELIAGHITDILKHAGAEGMQWSNLTPAVGERLTADEAQRLGKLGWHVVTVKLEMEVRGEVERLPGKGPQKLVLPQYV
ncbi:MAG: hypothetical protein AAF141_01725 [Pseudomonadota bacterium]